jgi:hypothetical protein
MTLNDACEGWSHFWLLAAPGVWTLLCFLSTAALGSILRLAGPPTVLSVTLALLGWSSRSDALDGFLFPVLVFCTSLVIAAGALRGIRCLNRLGRAQRWTVGSIAVFATACALILLLIAMVAGDCGDGRHLSGGRLGDGYFYRVSTYSVVSVVWVPPLFPVVERRVDPGDFHGEKLSVGTRVENGVTQLVVLYGGEEVDRLAL